jgi:hypothetical protein
MDAHASFLFNFPVDIIDEFTSMHCDSLAYILSNAINSQIYGIKETSDDPKDRPLDEPMHYVVKYRQYFVDIRGLWLEKDLLNDWKNTAVELSAKNSVYDYKLVLITKIPELGTSKNSVLYSNKIIDKLSNIYPLENDDKNK